MSALWLLLGLAALAGDWGSSSWGCYGNIPTLETPGASCGVGRPRGLNYSGVRASERLAEIDIPQLVRYQPITQTVGRKYCVDPAVITAVLSRQAHGGNVLVNVGDVGDGVGVVQDTGLLAPKSWISESQVAQMTEVLTVGMKEIRGSVLCSYNGGVGYVRSSQALSCNFCNDVLGRAKYYKRHGF
ncbi:lysozyme g-like protein 1 [Dugong dugon]